MEVLVSRFEAYLASRNISIREAERQMKGSNGSLNKAIELKRFSFAMLKKIRKTFSDFKIDDQQLNLNDEKVKTENEFLKRELESSKRENEALRELIDLLKGNVPAKRKQN